MTPHLTTSRNINHPHGLPNHTICNKWCLFDFETLHRSCSGQNFPPARHRWAGRGPLQHPAENTSLHYRDVHTVTQNLSARMDASYGSISEKILLDITVLFWESNGAYSNRVHCFYCFWLRSSRRLSRRQSNQSLAKSGHVQLTGWSAQQQQKLCASLLRPSGSCLYSIVY